MQSTSNILLVHGAWADGSSWGRVIPLLEAAGHNVVGVQIALNSLADDIAVTRRALDGLQGPTVVVGHSYGGSVISGAAHGASNVAGLVFVAAFAPDEGETLGQIVGRFPPQESAQFIKPYAAGYLFLDRDHFRQFFAQDVDPVTAEVMAAVQKPFFGGIFGEPAGTPAWREAPTWYVVSAQDRMIQPDAERWMAERMGAKTITLQSSHAAMVSHPFQVADLILQAARAGVA